MRARLNKLVAFLFGQNFPHVVHEVYEDPDSLGYEQRTYLMSGGSGAPVKYGAHGMSDDAQKAYLAWVEALPETERV